MCMPALGLIGAVVQGVGGAMGAMQQSNSYKLQAEMDRRQAGLERERGSYEGKRATERGMQAVGAATAGAAASGLNPSTGTTKELIVQTGENAALDVAAVRYGATIAAANAQNRATVNQYNARSAAAAAPIAFLSPILGGLGQFGTSLSPMFSAA